MFSRLVLWRGTGSSCLSFVESDNRQLDRVDPARELLAECENRATISAIAKGEESSVCLCPSRASTRASVFGRVIRKRPLSVMRGRGGNVANCARRPLGLRLGSTAN